MGKEEIEVVETKTTLSSIEISNYLPSSTKSISNGYTKISYNLIGTSNPGSIIENFNVGDLNNMEIYFDSTGYSFLKNIPEASFLSPEILCSVIKNNLGHFNNKYPELENKKLELVCVEPKLNREVLITLEVPTDKTIDWSIIKIWTIDKEKSRPQIHSILFAKANNFSSVILEDNNLLLKEGDLIYRIVLNDDLQFFANMEVFVSLSFE